ncbi:MAG: SPFH domain-containing protein [Alistipes sp.]|nr:SPFH domain-containing protein [Alistipes sp.]
MENKNYTYNGWKCNGIAALLMTLALLGLSIWSIVEGGTRLDEGLKPHGGIFLAAGLVGVVLSIIAMCGFMLLEPNQARVMLFFGEYRGTFYETGYWWVNPFMSAKQISVRARNLNVDPIKVNDKTGNPIMIGLVLVWRIKQNDIYKAVFEIDSVSADGTPVSASKRMNILENFVSVQSDAALRQVAGCYAYDNNDANNNELTLRSNSDSINEQLERTLNERLELAGIEVMEARINYLAYAPEIAAVMLRRQQADAIISAREKIVEGAVSMVQMALQKLSAEEIVELDEERKAAMVSNLLVVLCADEAATPVVNAGTLHH